jgi:hypothetical protein
VLVFWLLFTVLGFARLEAGVAALLAALFVVSVAKATE